MCGKPEDVGITRQDQPITGIKEFDIIDDADKEEDTKLKPQHDPCIEVSAMKKCY